MDGILFSTLSLRIKSADTELPSVSEKKLVTLLQKYELTTNVKSWCRTIKNMEILDNITLPQNRNLAVMDPSRSY